MRSDSMARSMPRWIWTRSSVVLKKPRRRSLEQALEEPLDGGQWAGHQVAESSRGTLRGQALGPSVAA